MDRPLRVLRLQEQQLRADQRGAGVVDLAVQEDDPLAQQARIDVEGAFPRVDCSTTIGTSCIVPCIDDLLGSESLQA
jgi:hypothetical protein